MNINPLCSLFNLLTFCEILELPAKNEGDLSPGWALEFPRKEGAASAALIVLRPGSQDVVHEHRSGTETYICLSGHGVLRIDGENQPFDPGDSVVIYEFTDHGAAPLDDETLVFLCVSAPSFDPENFYPIEGQTVL